MQQRVLLASSPGAAAENPPDGETFAALDAQTRDMMPTMNWNALEGDFPIDRFRHPQCPRGGAQGEGFSDGFSRPGAIRVSFKSLCHGRGLSRIPRRRLSKAILGQLREAIDRSLQ